MVPEFGPIALCDRPYSLCTLETALNVCDLFCFELNARVR
jgi:hypothetical protein